MVKYMINLSLWYRKSFAHFLLAIFQNRSKNYQVYPLILHPCLYWLAFHTLKNIVLLKFSKIVKSDVKCVTFACFDFAMISSMTSFLDFLPSPSSPSSVFFVNIPPPKWAFSTYSPSY